MKVKHHNSTVRHDALTGLQDIFSSRPAILLENLPKLVEQVFPVVVDVSAKVRQALLVLIRTVTNLLEKAHVLPFFPVLVAHLNCGLTHISEKIQLDSLKILDIYVAKYSDLLTGHFGTVFPTLLTLLLRYRTNLQRDAKPKQKGVRGIVHGTSPTLDSNPSNVLVSKESRLNILNIMKSFLEAMLKKRLFQEPSSRSTAYEDEEFLGLADNMIAVLFECWVECHPEDVFSSKNPSSDSLLIMECVVGVLLTLARLLLLETTRCADLREASAGISALCDKISSGIVTHIARHFPLSMSKQLPALGLQLYVKNFTFCHLILCLHKTLHMLGSSDDGGSTVVAVLSYFSSLNSSDIHHITSLSHVLLMCSQVLTDMLPLVLSVCHESAVCGDQCSSLFKFVKELYEACHPQSKSKQLFVKCISSIFVEEQAYSGQDSRYMVDSCIFTNINDL